MIKLKTLINEEVRPSIQDSEGKDALDTLVNVVGGKFKPDRHNIYNFKDGTRSLQVMAKVGKSVGIWISIAYETGYVVTKSYYNNEPMSKIFETKRKIKFSPKELENPSLVVLKFKKELQNLAKQAMDAFEFSAKQQGDYYKSLKRYQP